MSEADRAHLLAIFVAVRNRLLAEIAYETRLTCDEQAWVDRGKIV